MTTLIEFEYARVIDELRSFADFFTSFSAPNCESPDAIWRTLQAARETVASRKDFTWQIATERPIRTRVSAKAVEGGELNLAVGEFSMIWRLRQGRSPGKGKLPSTFSVLSASSVLKIIEIVPAGEFTAAEWHVDIGDIEAPGCRLHAQFADDVPRIPAPFALPSDSLAFLANELFPRTWPTEMASSQAAKFHGPRQGARLAAILRGWATAVSTGSDPFGELWRFRDYAASVAA